MALSDEDKAEFAELFSGAMTKYESDKAEAEAKNKPPEVIPPNDNPPKRSFAERLLGH